MALRNRVTHPKRVADCWIEKTDVAVVTAATARVMSLVDGPPQGSYGQVVHLLDVGVA